MTDTSDALRSPKFRVWLRPDGIVQVVWQPGAEIGLENIVALSGAVDTLTGGHRHPLMVDARAGAVALDRASRMKLGRRDESVSAIAVVINTPLARLSGNIFLAMRKPTPPMRLFDDEASALAWLGEFAP